jgi:hypothetical protein
MTMAEPLHPDAALARAVTAGRNNAVGLCTLHFPTVIQSLCKDYEMVWDLYQRLLHPEMPTDRDIKQAAWETAVERLAWDYQVGGSEDWFAPIPRVLSPSDEEDDRKYRHEHMYRSEPR